MFALLKKRGFKALLVTQFLGAFNDNAFKMVISLLAIKLFVTSSSGTIYVSLAGALFILPFLLFSTYAGFLADRFSKRTVIIWAKVAELFVMIMGFIAFVMGSIWLMFVVLFLMGTQSAFFGPSKYGIIPELLTEEELSWGNGILNMWTNLAIILGMASGGFFLAFFKERLYMVSMIFILISLAGILTSIFISKVAASGSRRKFRFNFVTEILNTMKDVYRSWGLYLSIMGTVYFYLLAGLFQLSILIYAKNMMNLSETYSGILVTMIALGLACGSVLAGKFSEGKIEFGLVPLGSIGLSIFSIFLGLSYNSFLITGICLFMLGISGGFFLVPLVSYIQGKSHYQMRGRILAANYFLQFLAIFLANGMLWFLREIIHLNTAQIFIYIGIVTIAVSVYICKLLPDALIRFVLWVITHSIYKIKAVGKEHIPAEGPALLVANHVSYIDGFLIQFSLSRPVRFVVYGKLYRNPLLKILFNLANAIPVSAEDSPKEIIKAFKKVKEELNKGGLVCIFAEGQLSRTGNMLPFNKGFEYMVKGTNCPIIPVYLDRVWGSIFSFKDNKFFFKIPKRIPYPVTVSFGELMPPDSKVFAVRQKVLELGSEAFKYRVEDYIPLPLAFWREAKKHPFKFCMADSTGKKLSYGKALYVSLALSKIIKKHMPPQKMVGILLPSSVAAVLSNISVSLTEMIPVNINFTLSQEVMEKIVDQCNINYIITSRKFLKKRNIPQFKNMLFIEDLVKEMSIIPMVVSIIKAWLMPVKMYARFKLKKTLSDSMQNVATIIFSSGSTGVPKGIMLTHANITTNVEGFYQIFNIEKNDKVLGILPLFHSFGFTATLWFPLLSGAGVVYHYNPLEAEVIGKLADKYKPTLLLSTPTFLLSYIRKIKPEQFKSLKYLVVGAEKLKEKIAWSFYEKFNIVPMEGYGATELSPIVSVSVPDYSFKKENKIIHQVCYKASKVGHPLPGEVVKVVNPETFAELGPDQDGLLLVKGGNVMAGYLHQPELTKAVMYGDWYITGDIGNIDEDGFIQLTSRQSRFSKIGGEMVPHIGTEEMIHTVLNAIDQLCVVTSVSDEKKGEKLVVLYTVNLDPQDICKKMNESNISKLWIPRSSNFHRIENIPLLGSGKLDLSAIKKIAEEIYSGKS